MTDINNNSNNNNNNNNNNEANEAFWKVFHNKFLLYSILKHVHNTEWTKYTEPYEIHACNRVKFKNIGSFSWLIQKKLYTLLKYKILSNEHLYIDENSIKRLFTEISTTKSKEEKDQLIEIMKLLNQHKKDQFEICDLTKLSTDSNNLQLLELLTNEPFNCQIYPSTLSSSIKKCSLEFVEKVIELLIKSYGKLIIDQDILENSIHWAYRNYKYSEEMLNLVVLKRPELSDGKSLPLSKDNDFKRINFYSFINFKSIQLKLKLMELNYINIDKNIKEDCFFKEDSLSFSINSNVTFDELLFKFKVYKYIICKNGTISTTLLKQIDEISKLTNEYKKLKQLSKLIILDTNGKGSLYRQYIIKYNESINEFTFNGLSDTLHSNNDGSNYSNCLNLLRFISLQKNQIYSNNIETIKQIMNSWFNGFKWFPLYSYLTSTINIGSYNLIINDKEIIDWMFSTTCTNNVLVHSFFKELFDSNKVQVESIELLNYLFNKNKDSSLFKLNNQFLFKHTWRKSIQQCDIAQLKLIDSYRIQFISDYGEFIDGNDLINSNTHPDKLMELIDYLNQSEYIGFTISIFEKFLDSLLKYQIDNPTFNNGNPLELNFQSFSSETINRLISNSAARLNLSLFKLLITNVEKLSIMDQLSDYDYRFLQSQDKFIFGEGENSIYHSPIYGSGNSKSGKIKEIIEIIQLLINKLLKCRLNKYESTVLDSYLVMINYFFEKLIQMEGIQSDQVIKIWKQLQDNEIEIQHSLYNSFFYLHIRDPKLSKYILSRPYVKTPIIMGPNILCAPQYFDTTIQYTNGNYHLREWLNHDKFTFDFIFGLDLSGKYINSFDYILNELIQDLSIKPIPNRLYNDYFSATLNADLQFTLEIKRKDLFFKSLEYIQLHHDKSMYSKYSHDSPCALIKMNGPLLNGNQVQINHINSLKALPIESNNQLPSTNKKPTKQIDESNFLITKLNITNYNLFNLSKKSIQLISVLLELNEVQKVIEMFFHQQGLVFEILEQSIWLNNYELSKFILDNYKIEFKNLNFFTLDQQKEQQQQNQYYSNYSPYKYDPYSESKLILENYFDELPQHPSRFEKPLSLNVPFELGLINYCNLILKYYPEIFQITKQMITSAINNDHIHILKYYFKSFIKPNQDLLQCLITQLSKHSDYKNDLNWVLINN